MDDAIGPYIADKLKGKKSNDYLVLDCGTVPENYTAVVKRHNPKNLIIIDAVEMGLDPGEIRVVPKEKIGSMHVSTHGIPLSVLIEYLREHIENIFLIGIQPGSMSGQMTSSVERSGDKLVEIIKNNKLTEIEILQ